jgi:hypothetical protein
MSVILKAHLAALPSKAGAAAALVHERDGLASFVTLPGYAMKQFEGEMIAWFHAEPFGNGYVLIRRVEDQNW